jgi:hypothetical protein
MSSKSNTLHPTTVEIMVNDAIEDGFDIQIPCQSEELEDLVFSHVREIEAKNEIKGTYSLIVTETVTEDNISIKAKSLSEEDVKRMYYDAVVSQVMNK